MSDRLTLENGALYRVLTRAGRVYEGMRWRAARFAFTNQGRTVPIDEVERVAPRLRLSVAGRYAPAGGESFVPVSRCYLAKPEAVGS
jgi:hypothetical protein